jgi:hypothetical protein
MQIRSETECCSKRQFTKNNWYAHLEDCKPYQRLRIGLNGEPKIQNGRINIPHRASAQSSRVQQPNGEIECPPQGQKPVRRISKRRRQESEEEGEYQEKRKTKVKAFPLVHAPVYYSLLTLGSIESQTGLNFILCQRTTLHSNCLLCKLSVTSWRCFISGRFYRCTC